MRRRCAFFSLFEFMKFLNMQAPTARAVCGFDARNWSSGMARWLRLGGMWIEIGWVRGSLVDIILGEMCLLLLLTSGELSSQGLWGIWGIVYGLLNLRLMDKMICRYGVGEMIEKLCDGDLKCSRSSREVLNQNENSKQSGLEVLLKGE